MPEPRATMIATDFPGKRAGCLLYSLGVAIVLAVLLSFGVAAWYNEAKARFESEAASIARRGEPLWFADLQPEAVDRDEDASRLVLHAASKLVRPAAGFDELLTADPPTPPGLYEVLETNLAVNRPALEILAEGFGMPHCRFPYDFQTKQTLAILLDHTQQCRHMARLLEADVLHSLVLGEPDRAVAAVVEELDLSELLREDPFIISQLVRCSIAASAIRSLQTTVAHATLTAEQFAALDERLAGMGASFMLRPAVVADRACALTAMQHLAENVDMIDGLDAAQAAKFNPERWYLRPALWREEAFMLHALGEFADLVDKTGPEAIRAVKDLESRYQRDSEELTLNRLIGSVSFRFKPHIAGLRHRQRLIIARLGMRVARYRTEHGELPASLDAIADEGLRPLLVDLFSGKPLVYRVTADGFVIYPVGEDGIDNGGGTKPDETEHLCRFEVNYPKPANPSDQPPGQPPSRRP